MVKETIVIYHGGCRDGFCSAWVVNKFLFAEAELLNSLGRSNEIPNIIYHPGYYGQEPPNCKGKDVIIVDFSYPINTMIKLSEQCANLIWLDHHKTAKEVNEYFENNAFKFGTSLDWRFDLKKSGAGIAWDYFFPNEDRPWLVNYVEDRDLWNKALPETDKINSFIACLEFNFEVWDKWSQEHPDDITMHGEIAEMKTEQYVREVCKNVYFADISNPSDLATSLTDNDWTASWDKIPVVNICQVDCSEVLHELCNKYPNSPFSMYWFKRQDGLYQYGLRSVGDFDVSAVAKLFGGGGHKNAAGFQLPYLLGELK